MKKPLLLLFSLMLSFNSYGEWTPITINIHDDIFYLDLERTNEKEGDVYYWYLKDLNEPKEGVRSATSYIQGDCEVNRFKELSFNHYGELKGVERITSSTPDNPEWDYYPPDSVGEVLLDIVCGLEEAYKESYEEYQKFVEEVLEYSKDTVAEIETL